MRFSFRDKEILRGLSLEVHAGETVTLVGATGSGKTTECELIPRLAEVSGGAIRIDGVDIRNMALQDLRTMVATAFEEPVLFSASVAENVAHRASTVAIADRVALLSGGKITAVGTHSELMAHNGEYRELLSTMDDSDAEEVA